MICADSVIPDNERWLHTPAMEAAIQQGLAKLQSAPPTDRLDELSKAIVDDQQPRQEDTP